MICSLSSGIKQHIICCICQLRASSIFRFQCRRRVICRQIISLLSHCTLGLHLKDLNILFLPPSTSNFSLLLLLTTVRLSWDRALFMFRNHTQISSSCRRLPWFKRMKATPSNSVSEFQSWLKCNFDMKSVGQCVELELSWQSLQHIPVHHINQNLIQKLAAKQLLFRELI